MIASVQRADRILDLFTVGAPSWTITEIATELDLSKSIIWEYAKTLESLGILRRDSDARYRLGWRTFNLGLHARMTSEIATPARTLLHKLANDLQETIQLSTRHRSEVVYLEKSVPPAGVRLNATRVGHRLPAHTTSSGKVFLSTLTDAELTDLYPSEELPQQTPGSLKTRADLKSVLEKVKVQGYSLDHEETIPGLNGIAVPVKSRHGDFVWSISLTHYSYKSGSTVLRYKDALLSAADELSRIAISTPS